MTRFKRLIAFLNISVSIFSVSAEPTFSATLADGNGKTLACNDLANTNQFLERYAYENRKLIYSASPGKSAFDLLGPNSNQSEQNQNLFSSGSSLYDRRTRLLADAKTRLGQQNDADHLLSKFSASLKYAPFDADAHVIRGFIYIDKKNYSAAIEDFNAALEANEQDAMAYGGLCDANHGLGHKDLTISNFGLANALSRREATDARLQYPEISAAISDATKSLDLVRNTPSILSYRNCAKQWSDIGYNDKSLELTTKALEFPARNASDYINRSNYSRLESTRFYYADDSKKQDEYLVSALTDLNEALKMDPANPWAYASRAQLSLAQGFPEPAIKDLESAEKQCPQYSSAYAIHGCLLRELCEFDAAFEKFLTAMLVDPASAETNVSLLVKERRAADVSLSVMRINNQKILGPTGKSEISALEQLTKAAPDPAISTAEQKVNAFRGDVTLVTQQIEHHKQEEFFSSSTPFERQSEHTRQQLEVKLLSAQRHLNDANQKLLDTFAKNGPAHLNRLKREIEYDVEQLNSDVVELKFLERVNNSLILLRTKCPEHQNGFLNASNLVSNHISKKLSDIATRKWLTNYWVENALRLDSILGKDKQLSEINKEALLSLKVALKLSSEQNSEWNVVDPAIFYEPVHF